MVVEEDPDVSDPKPTTNEPKKLKYRGHFLSSKSPTSNPLATTSSATNLAENAGTQPHHEVPQL